MRGRNDSLRSGDLPERKDLECSPIAVDYSWPYDEMGWCQENIRCRFSCFTRFQDEDSVFFFICMKLYLCIERKGVRSRRGRTLQIWHSVPIESSSINMDKSTL